MLLLSPIPLALTLQPIETPFYLNSCQGQFLRQGTEGSAIFEDRYRAGMFQLMRKMQEIGTVLQILPHKLLSHSRPLKVLKPAIAETAVSRFGHGQHRCLCRSNFVL